MDDWVVEQIINKWILYFFTKTMHDHRGVHCDVGGGKYICFIKCAPTKSYQSLIPLKRNYNSTKVKIGQKNGKVPPCHDFPRTELLQNTLIFLFFFICVCLW